MSTARNRAVAATRVVIYALTALGPALSAQQSSQPPLPDVQRLGPQIGTRVPDFTLLDQTGQSRSLTSLIGPKGLMLVFFRSADW